MAKKIDLTNQTIGNWKVIKYIGNQKWLCECQCENHIVKEVNQYSLLKGASTSCGCLRKTKTSKDKLEDLTGKQFGDWKVLEYRGNSMWLCECQCENHTLREVKAQSLKSGASKSCGHSTTGFKDLSNKIFGNWKVLTYKGEQRWLCECQCENHTLKEVSTYNLVNGLSKSCGCTKLNSSKLIDLKDQTFGELKVLKYVGGNKWLCECSCGNKSIHYSHNLRRSNGTISCGCKEIKTYTRDEVISAIVELKNTNGYEPFADEICEILDRSITTVRRYIDKYELQHLLNKQFKSKCEYQIWKLFPTDYVNCRSIIDSELDLYYPNEKIAIEFNGSYWHSELFKNKEYHQNKSIECYKKGIKLIHIFEYEWNDNNTRNKIIDLIRNNLELNSNKIYARNTEVKIINKDSADNFLNKYHIQNSINASYYLGCFFNNELIGVMTFGSPRFNTNFQYELLRLCWKSGIQVIGGTQKMFKHFISIAKPESIITYCNIAKFSGNVYTGLGFKTIDNKLSEPNYVWWNAQDNYILTRYKTQKHKLIEQGLGTPEQTEDEIMHSLGFYKIYDSGNLRLAWYKDK